MTSIHATGGANGGTLDHYPKKQAPKEKEESAKKKAIAKQTEATRAKIAGLGEGLDVIG